MAGRMRDSTEMIGKMSGKIDNLNSEMLNLRKQMEAAEREAKIRLTAPVQHTSIAENTASREVFPDLVAVEVVVAAIEAKMAQGMIEEIPDKILDPLIVTKKKIITVPIEEENVRATRHPSAAAAPVPTPVPAARTPPLPVPSTATPVPEITVKVPVKPVVPVDIKSEQKEYDDDCVQIIFPFKFNRDLISSGSARLDKYGERIDSAKVRVLRGITCDDLVFELRHYIATEVCI